MAAFGIMPPNKWRKDQGWVYYWDFRLASHFLIACATFIALEGSGESR